jgi:cation-transporting P-type ATPase C
MFSRREPPLLQAEILHQLPGRVRIAVRALRYLGPVVGAVSDRIQSHPAVRSVRLTTITTNALVLFDPDRATPEDIRSFVESEISGHALIAFKEERLARSRLTVSERRLQEETVKEIAGRVAVTSATLLLSWIRGAGNAAGLSLIRRFTTMPALTALSLAAPIVRSGLRSLRESRRPNADTLTSTAILCSLLTGQDVSAVTIIWLADIAELLTAYTMDRTRNAIRDMLSLGEDEVWRLTEDGREQKVPVEALRPGDRVMVHTGAKISVDGQVEDGAAAVDQASITGEFLPAQKGIGDEVFAGTVVTTGSLVVRAERVGDDTAVARIVHMVEEASHRKAAIQMAADRLSAQFIPVNFALAALVLMITRSPTRALNMLIIDYSCGVRLSTATALSASICTAARAGILVKGGNYLEQLDTADTLIFDKTGTLTEGTPLLTSIVPLDNLSERRLVELSAAAEEASTHPLAAAILNTVRRRGWKIPDHGRTQVHVALGMEVAVGRSTIRVGSRRFMTTSGIDVAPAETAVARLVAKGESVVYVARGRRLIGVLGIQDALRDNMKKALNRLRLCGVDDIVLLTGDVEQHAEVVASRMAMDRFEAELLPEDKAEVVLRLQSQGVRVAMIGDGINDAPALAYADVGIALGGRRTDIAIEASDITIASDDPLMIPGVTRLARETMNVVRQNFGISIGVNTAALMSASLGVLPVFWGAVAHNATTVAVVLNSARLLWHDVWKWR